MRELYDGPPGQTQILEDEPSSAELRDAALYQERVLRERIYHEDGLLGTRSYNFLTAQAFLVTALASTVAGQSRQHERLFILLIATLGLCIGLVHWIVTVRTVGSIAFWRERLRELERYLSVRPWVAFDANLEEPDSGRLPSPLLYPFRIATINKHVSWIVPCLLCSFWVSAIVWIYYSI